jgi:hypothetical protein
MFEVAEAIVELHAAAMPIDEAHFAARREPGVLDK